MEALKTAIPITIDEVFTDLERKIDEAKSAMEYSFKSSLTNVNIPKLTQ